MCLCLVLLGCRKSERHGRYTISGRLLESTSNPLPVTFYNLELYQRDQNAFLGGVSGISQVFQSDVNGFFSITYTPGESYGFGTGGTNKNDLYLSGIDTVKYKNLYPSWSPLPPNKDTLINLFMYKKIEKFVRKVQFNKNLASYDSLEVITSAAYRSHYKIIKGPIDSGSVVIVDTIRPLLSERFNITEQK